MMVKKKPSWRRNLQPQDLGAVIFGCTHNTFVECHTRQLFGLPRAHFSYVKNIKQGLPLFLFNYDDRQLHGIYEAASNGKFCPQSNAWSRSGKEKTGYPAQVAMRLKLRCSPLAESQFRNAIQTNYYQMMPDAPGRMCHFFHFELDHAQTSALINMFTPLPAPYNFWTPSIASPVHEQISKSKLPPACTAESEGNSDVQSEQTVKPCVDVVQKVKPEEVGYVGVNADHASTNYDCSSGLNDLDSGDTPLEGRDCTLSNKDAKLQQQSGQQDKKLSLELQKFKVLSPQQHSSESCANAIATSDIGTYSCKDVQVVKSTILDGPSNMAGNFDAEVGQLSLGHSKSLDFKSHTEAKMMNTRCTAINQLCPPLPALTRQFQETDTQPTRAVYETPNNNDDNGAPEATDSACHLQPHRAESTSIRPLTASSAIECTKDENSLRKERKRKKTTLGIERCPDGHDEIHNMRSTKLPSPHYVSCYIKDRLIGKITCMVCGEEGHYTCDCPMKDQENKVMCTLCNKLGHCYLWCCRQHVSENRACRRCGEKGHYTNKHLSHCDEKYTNVYVGCSSCDESHPLGRCPMGKVTCFLCEGKDHVPAHCRLSPMLTATQYYRENFQTILKKALAETSRRDVTPAKPSNELEPCDDSDERQFKRNGEMVHTVSSIFRCEQGDCERKNVTKSVLYSDKAKHAALTEKVLTPRSSTVCFNCLEDGHYANKCPKKKLPGELELSDCKRKNAAKSLLYFDKAKHAALTEKVLTRGSSSVCFNCHEEGHYAKKCPKKKLCGELELSDVTCFKFRANRCHKKQPVAAELCDVTCFYCHDKGHYSYSCPLSKPPGGLELHDVTCFNFDANTCDRNKPTGELL